VLPAATLRRSTSRAGAPPQKDHAGAGAFGQLVKTYPNDPLAAARNIDHETYYARPIQGRIDTFSRLKYKSGEKAPDTLPVGMALAELNEGCGRSTFSV
jgi:hypothetical protein